MSLHASSVFSDRRSSRQVGLEVGRQILAGLAGPPRLLLTYLTILHDQPEFLAGLREATGGAVPVVGCSTQGVMGRGVVREEGYAASVLGLAGDLEVASAVAEGMVKDARGSGLALGRRLRGDGPPPRLVVLHWDPLSGVDIGLLLEGLSSVVECPIVGGAASHHYQGQLHQTFLHFGDRVLSGGAVAVALRGDFGLEMASCQGCSPSGVELTVTRADGNAILEFDGRPATEVWTGLVVSDPRAPHADHASIAIGVLSEGATAGEHLVRAAYFLDQQRQGIVVGTAIAAGTRVILHQRTVDDVLSGAERLGRELSVRLAGRRPVALLGFECGARTGPFLGEEATLDENLALQAAVAPGAAWAGAMMWGELFPVAGRAAFHNYTFPLVAFTE